MKKVLLYAGTIGLLVSWVPLVLVARERGATKTEPRIHILQDMDAQAKFRPQSANPIFADGRAMRLPVEGTVARGSLDPSSPVASGKDPSGAWLTRNALPVTVAMLERGRERYEIFCAPCHGSAGYGDGPVSRRAERLQEGTWTPPSSMHAELVLGREDGHIFHTITHGIRNMPAYGSQIPPEDRWAIVGYIRALQRSQGSRVDALSAADRERLP